MTKKEMMNEIISIKKLEGITSIGVLQEKAADIFRKYIKNYEDYEYVSLALVDQKFLDNPVPYAIPCSWWQHDYLVTAERLNLKLVLDLRDNLQRCIYFTGMYEPQTIDFIKSKIKYGDVFIDIGAHIGVYSLVIANKLKELGGGYVYAFEPTEDSSSKLRNNAKNNNLDIHVIQMGLSDSAKSEVPLYGDEKWGIEDAGVRSIFGEGPVICHINLTTFDMWAKQNFIPKVDIIKIDADGAEYNIIKGMQTTLKKCRPGYIVMELKDSELLPAGRTKDEMVFLMKELGYVCLEDEKEHNQIFTYKGGI